EARARVALALGRAGSKSAVAWLERLYREAGPDEQLLRDAATVALARLGARTPEEAAAAVTASLGDPRPAVVQNAVEGLGARPPGIAAQALEPKLQDSRSNARVAEAAKVLGLKALAPGLAILARNGGEPLATRAAAVRALAELGDPVAGADAVAS